jgi:lipopolysaccharide export system protein LptA
MLIIFSISTPSLFSQTEKDSLYTDSSKVTTILSDTLLLENIKNLVTEADSINNDSLKAGDLLINAVQTDSTIKEQIEDDFMDYEVVYNAVDSILFDLSTNEVHLFGESYVKYGDITLTSENIIYDLDSYLVSAEGGVDSAGNPINLPIFKQGQEEFSATTIKYNFNTEKGYIKDVYSETNQAFVYAKISKKQPNNHVHIKGGFFTTCSNPNPHYSFRTTKMIVIPDDKIIVGPGYVAVGKLPLPVGLPFLSIPNKSNQASGIVIPQYGDSKEQGFFLRDGGFYWAINDYFHTEILGTIYANGSWGLKNNSAYVKRYKFSGNFTLNYNDFVFGDRDIEGDFTQSKSFAVKWNHRQDAKASKYSSFNSVVNFTRGTQYRDDIGSSNQDYINRNFNSNISYRYIVPNSPFTVNANAVLNQRILNNDTLRYTVNEITLPKISINMKRVDIPMAWIKKNKVGQKKWFEKIGITYSLNAQNRLEYSPELLELNNISIDGDNFRTSLNIRNALDQKANLSTSFKVKTLSISPFINGVANTYTQRIVKSLNTETYDTETDTIRDLSTVFGFNSGLNLTTKLYGMYDFKSDGAVKAMRHQITFSAGAAYSPGNSSNEFGYLDSNALFTNYSPYEGAISRPPNSRASNTYNFRILNDLEAKVRQKNDSSESTYNKVKFIDNLSVSASLDAFKDSVKWSDIRLNGRFTKLFNILTINYKAVFDPYAYNTKNQKIGESYLSQTGKIVRIKSAGVVGQLKFKSKNKGTAPKPKNEAEQRIVDMEKEKEKNNEGSFFQNLNIPWAFNVNYNFNIVNKPEVDAFGNLNNSAEFIQTLDFSGTFTIIKIFRFNISSGYDFKANSIKQTTRVALYVDLHCWELSLSVIPFGRRKSYSVSFNVKSSLLSDLKIKKQDTYGGGAGFF